jgi:release factor glutamine methyltransferase
MKPPDPGLAEHETRRLLMLALGVDAAGLAARREMTGQERARFDALVARRKAGEPLQYIEGTVQFGPIEIAVDRRVLIPRPETEVLWEHAAKALAGFGPEPVVVDIGTGSGNLALALKHVRPDARVYATDVDEDALDLAASNAGELDLDVTFLQGDVWDALPFGMRGHIDLLVSNPPYVAAEAMLPAEVVDHEPASALFSGPGGLDVLTRIAGQAFLWVKSPGWVFIEIGEDQGAEATALFGAFECEVLPDLAGRPRVLKGFRGATACVEGAK